MRTYLWSFLAVVMMIAASASSAWADLVFASSVTATDITGTNTFTNVTAAAIHDVDGSVLLVGTPSGASSFRITLSFTTFTTVAQDPSLHIFVGSIGGGPFSLDSVRFRDLAGGTFDRTVNVNLGLTTNRNDYIFTAGQINAGLGSGTFNSLIMDTMALNFSGAPGSTLGLDQIVHNPEPGTIALFTLGAFGLAGLVWRRRRSYAALAA